MIRKERPALIGQSIEFPWIALAALVIREGNPLDDIGIDQLLYMLVNRRLAHLGFSCSSSYIDGSCLGCWRMLWTSANRVC